MEFAGQRFPTILNKYSNCIIQIIQLYHKHDSSFLSIITITKYYIIVSSQYFSDVNFYTKALFQFPSTKQLSGHHPFHQEWWIWVDWNYYNSYCKNMSIDVTKYFFRETRFYVNSCYQNQILSLDLEEGLAQKKRCRY